MRALMAYPWPGNVRQLENAVERAVALSAGRETLDVADLPPEVQTTPQADRRPRSSISRTTVSTCRRYLAAIEKDLIQRALDRTRGNRNRAADLLGIKRTTLVEKLRDWGLNNLMPCAGGRGEGGRGQGCSSTEDLRNPKPSTS